MKSKDIKIKFIIDSKKENWFIDYKYSNAEKSIGKDRFTYIINSNVPNVYNRNREIFYKNIKKYIKLNKKTINSETHNNSGKIINRWKNFENKFFRETEKITGVKWGHKIYKTYFLYSCFWGGDYDINKPNIYINPLLKFGDPLYVIFHELTHLLYWECIYSKYSEKFITKNYNLLWKLSEIMVNYPLMKLGIGFKFPLVIPKYLETFGKNIIKKFPKMTFVDIVNSEIKKGAE